MLGLAGDASYELQMFVWFFMIVVIFKLRRSCDELCTR